MYVMRGPRQITDEELSKLVAVEVMRYLGHEGVIAKPNCYATDPKLAERALARLRADFPDIQEDMTSFYPAEDHAYARALCLNMIEAVRLYRSMGCRPARVTRVERQPQR